MASEFEQTLQLLQQLNVEPHEILGHTIVDKDLEKALIHDVAENGNIEVLKVVLKKMLKVVFKEVLNKC